MNKKIQTMTKKMNKLYVKIMNPLAYIPNKRGMHWVYCFFYSWPTFPRNFLFSSFFSFVMLWFNLQLYSMQRHHLSLPLSLSLIFSSLFSQIFSNFQNHCFCSFSPSPIFSFSLTILKTGHFVEEWIKRRSIEKRWFCFVLILNKKHEKRIKCLSIEFFVLWNNGNFF